MPFFIPRGNVVGTSGAGAPSTAPLRVGDLYTDTTGDAYGKITYVAHGTSTTADWKQITTQ